MSQRKKRVSLTKWADQFDPKPCHETLLRWTRGARIYPAPEKIGRAYYVDENARYVDPAKSYGT